MGVWIRWSVSVAFAVALGGCAQKVANPCPNAPVPRCVTNLVCAQDPATGCQVCRCDKPAYVRPEETSPQLGPP